MSGAKKRRPPSELPYRPCVGVALFNAKGEVWVGQRADMPGEAEGPGSWWQMPQGGIDPGESPLDAAYRELYEETNISQASLLAETPDWLIYDLPPELLGKAWGGRFRGQRQKWFALRFEGEERSIDIHRPGGGEHRAEFMAWRWEPLERLPSLIVPFKRKVYDEVVAAFRGLTS